MFSIFVKNTQKNNINLSVRQSEVMEHQNHHATTAELAGTNWLRC